jgi:hypothetical protein
MARDSRRAWRVSAAPGNGAGTTSAPSSGQVALGVMLAQIHGQVRHPARMRLVATQRPRAQRPAHPLHDLGGHSLHQSAQPQGTQLAAVVAILRSRVNLRGGRVERRPGGMKRDVHRAEMSQGVPWPSSARMASASA